MATAPPAFSLQPATPQLEITEKDAAAKLGTSPSTASLTPASRIQGVLNKITETVQSPTTALAPDETGTVLVTDEKTGQKREMTLDELRLEYENETVDRFLRVFSRQVKSVEMPEELPPDIPGKDDKIPHEVDVPTQDIPLDDDEEEWHIEAEPATTIQGKIVESLQSPISAVSTAATTVKGTTIEAAQTVKENSNHTYVLLNEGEWHGRSPADYVAMNLIVPYLPRPHRKTYQFTFGGLQGTVGRLYLSCQPLYAPFMQRMVSLMMWEDPRRSFVYCVLFWVLWFFNLLLPALFARLTYALLRRRLLPYPSAKELVEHQNAMARADDVAAQIHAYLDSNLTSGVGVKDAWKMFRLATKTKKNKPKEATDDTPNEYADADWREDENTKRAALAIMEEIADFHERFANLAHWRDPKASMRYAIIMAVMILVPLFTPAQYVVKGIYAGAGFGFWFVPRLWLAIPLEHRSRIPAPLGDVPTDAEYAMDIISRRVDRGEAVLPPELRKKDKKKAGNAAGNRSTYSLSPSSTFNIGNKSVTSLESIEDSETLASAADKSKMRKFKDKMKGVVFVDQSKRRDSLDDNGQPLPEQTFPAKYHTQMGMLSLTPSLLLFYPMMSSTAKVSIPLASIRGVHKAGRMGGLRIKYIVPVEEAVATPRKSMDNASIVSSDARAINGMAVNGEPLEREEKFGWVSGRDEVFAKLVGWGGRRWVKM